MEDKKEESPLKKTPVPKIERSKKIRKEKEVPESCVRLSDEEEYSGSEVSFEYEDGTQDDLLAMDNRNRDW